MASCSKTTATFSSAGRGHWFMNGCRITTWLSPLEGLTKTQSSQMTERKPKEEGNLSTAICNK